MRLYLYLTAIAVAVVLIGCSGTPVVPDENQAGIEVTGQADGKNLNNRVNWDSGMSRSTVKTNRR